MTDKSSKPQIKDKPKICAIDLDKEIIEALQDRGLQCFNGSLGSQVKVPNSARCDTHPVLLNFNFPPNLHEYDIVIVDLQDHEPIEYNEIEHTRASFKGSEQYILLSSYPETIFDPRPFSASLLGKELQKGFLKKETLLIVFSAPQERIEYHSAVVTHRGYHEQNSVEYALYEFIPCVHTVRNKIGHNVVLSDITGDIGSLIRNYIKNFRYLAVFEHPTIWLSNERKTVERSNFLPLLFNSDNEIVGFVDFLFQPTMIFVFPQIVNKKKEFLLEFIDETLPGIFPKIFPYSEQFSWLKADTYFLPNQASLLSRKELLYNEYTKTLAKIEEEIKENQAKYKFLHDLLTETDEQLVKSVEIFFKWLGFTNVINMDESNPEIKEEDLQLILKNGLLVVEIKGIGGTSKDSDCSQVSKIKYRRSKERNSFDVSALYLVNHQRYLPPDKRKNPPFTEQQIADAQSDERGLLTTYELFKLYFKIEEGFVTKEDARAALLKYGLVQFKPSNASLLGFPLEVHHKGKVIILNIDNLPLREGATIIICNDGTWFKAEVLEIQVNGKKVESIVEGEVGVKLSHGVQKTSELWLQDIDTRNS